MDAVKYDTLVGRVLTRAREQPDRDALVSGAETVSYGKLGSRIVAAASALQARGVERGDRVLVEAASHPTFAYGYFGAHLLGAVAVPLNPAMPPVEFEDMIERVRARVAIGSTAFAHRALDRLEVVDRLADLPPSAEDFPGPLHDAPADILFTTGTSDRTKGVMLSHANVLAAATNINATTGNTADDREVLPLPLSHSFQSPGHAPMSGGGAGLRPMAGMTPRALDLAG